MLAWLATHGARAARSLLPDVLFRVDDASRTIYLTFDDGPTTDGTPVLLDLLDRYDARATFFLEGRHAEVFPGLTRALVEAGHTIGNHTFSHPDAWRTPEARVRDELDRTQAMLTDLTGRPVDWMRPPYGHFTRAMRAWCLERGVRMVLWDAMPADYLPHATAPVVERRIRRHVRPGSIVVLHDNPRVLPIMLPAVQRLLPDLAADGWRFEALTPTTVQTI